MPVCRAARDLVRNALASAPTLSRLALSWLPTQASSQWAEFSPFKIPDPKVLSKLLASNAVWQH